MDIYLQTNRRGAVVSNVGLLPIVVHTEAAEGVASGRFAFKRENPDTGKLERVLQSQEQPVRHLVRATELQRAVERREGIGPWLVDAPQWHRNWTIPNSIRTDVTVREGRWVGEVTTMLLPAFEGRSDRRPVKVKLDLHARLEYWSLTFTWGTRGYFFLEVMRPLQLPAHIPTPTQSPPPIEVPPVVVSSAAEVIEPGLTLWSRLTSG